MLETRSHAATMKCYYIDDMDICKAW